MSTVEDGAEAAQEDRAQAVSREPYRQNGAEPADKYEIHNEDIQFTVDLQDVAKIVERSPTFRKAVSQLAREGYEYDIEVGRLTGNEGGGQARGYGKTWHITIDPKGIWYGYNVIDIYIHEVGHIWEESSGTDVLTFTNTVQRELGLRETPETHMPPAPTRTGPRKRDPFQRPRR